MGTVVVGGLLIAACLIGANLLATRFPKRWILPMGTAANLTPKTARVLEGLERPVQVTVVARSGWPFLRNLQNLLDQVRFRSRWIRIDWVDPWLEPARAAAIASKYEMREQAVGMVVQAGDRIYRVDEYAMQKTEPSGDSTITRFDGESALLSGLVTVTSPSTPRVGFIVGHEEYSPDEYEPGRGLSDFSRALLRQGLEVERGEAITLLAQGTRAPDVLIVAGPRKGWAKEELDLLRQYVQAGGRALLLLDPDVTTGFAEWLLEWGIFLGQGTLQPLSGTWAQNLDLSPLVHVRQYPAHPVTSSLNGIQTTFYGVRAVRPIESESEAAGEGSTKRSALIRSVLQLDMEENENNAEAFPNANQGVFAVSFQGGAEGDLGVDLGKTRRLLVVGDSDFLVNGRLSGGNLDLGLHMVNWLLGREFLLEHGPEDKTPSPPPLDRDQRIRLLARGLLAPLILLLGIGMIVGLFRR
jgi:hypothetical protein